MSTELLEPGAPAPEVAASPAAAVDRTVSRAGAPSAISTMSFVGSTIMSAILFAKVVYQSGGGGKNCTGPYEIFARVMAGLELGLGPMESLRELFVVDGKVSSSGRLLMRLALRGGARVRWIERSETRATCEITSPDGTTEQWTWSVEDATRADLMGKRNWRLYGRQMLMWRALSMGLNFQCPDLLGGGLHMAEELGAETDAQGVPVKSGAPSASDVRKQMREIDEMLTNPNALRASGETGPERAARAESTEETAGPAAKANGDVPSVSGGGSPPADPPPARASGRKSRSPVVRKQSDGPAPGMVKAIREAADRAGLLLSSGLVLLSKDMRSRCGIDRDKAMAEWLADQVNADEILRELNEAAQQEGA